MGWHNATGRFRGVCFAASLVVIASGVCLAAGVSLDVKPGLWEIQTSGSASGAPQIPPEALAKLKPEQRAIAEAMMMAIVAQASTPHTLQFCVTPEQVRQGLDLNRMGGHDCRRNVQSSSPTGLDMQVDCTGRDQMSGVVHLRVVDRATVAGNVDLHAGLGTNSLTIRQDLHGHWLGAACGEVKPID
jgi:hypothetical protein